jgi:hypothetical protein
MQKHQTKSLMRLPQMLSITTLKFASPLESAGI